MGAEQPERGLDEAPSRVQGAVVGFGDGAERAVGVDPHPHGEVGATTARGKLETPHQRSGVVVDEDGDAPNEARFTLGERGVHGDRHHRRIFGAAGCFEADHAVACSDGSVAEVEGAQTAVPGASSAGLSPESMTATHWSPPTKATLATLFAAKTVASAPSRTNTTGATIDT